MAMKNAEKILYGKSLIAVIFRKNIKVEGVKFLTDEANPFQVGIHNRQKGTHLAPHVHRIEKPLIINSIQEILYVIEGKIRVSLYSTKGKRIASRVLGSGDSILLVSGGHGLDFIENSRIFEVKQGPYPGFDHAKSFL